MDIYIVYHKSDGALVEVWRGTAEFVTAYLSQEGESLDEYVVHLFRYDAGIIRTWTGDEWMRHGYEGDLS